MGHADAATVAELRRRIQGSFSLGELRSLGAALGLSPDPSWDRGADATVRDVVRRALESPGLLGLVEQLRRDRPLVEWDDLVPPARGGDTEIAEALPDLETQPTVVEAPVFDLTPPPMPVLLELGDVPPAGRPLAAQEVEATSAAPAALGAALTPAMTGASPMVATPAEPGSLASGEPAPPSRAAPPSASGPASASWPLQNLSAASDPPKRGLEPRLVAITAACLALAVVVAFVAGIVWSRQQPVADGGPGTRSEGLAGHAATAMESALIDVARGCGLEVPKVLGRDVLRVAQAGCGHPVTVAGRPPPGFDPNAVDPPKLDGGPATVRRPAPPSGGAVTPKAPSDGCRDECKSERNACKSACGDEPRDASDYEAWQGCNGKCLAAESKCRQGCK